MHKYIQQSLLSDGSGELNKSDNIFIGYSLSSSEAANYWRGAYPLTDVTTGTTFTNSFKYQ